MQKEYICDGVCKYTLSSGTEVTLSESDIEEIAKVINLFDELNDIIDDLENDILELKSNNDNNDETISSLEEEIDSLENKLFQKDSDLNEYKQKINQLNVMLNMYGLNDIFIKDFKELAENLYMHN